MVREIITDESFLSLKSEPATAADLNIARDLLDTLVAHKEGCVGMAANMIGERCRIIAFADGEDYTVMFNPRLIKFREPYRTKEGCLSLKGQRETKRYGYIKVQYENAEFKPRIKTYTGFTAEIIQHELDHCDGIII